MTCVTARSRRKLAGLMVLPVAAIALAACGPSAPPPPPTVNCTVGSTYSQAVEACHLNYHSYYRVETSSNGAEATVQRILGTITAAQCSSSLGNYHTSSSTLKGYYPGAQYTSENLYCSYYSNGQCPSFTLGATKAMNGWLASPGHKANMDSILSPWVNAAAGCVATPSGRGVYVAVAQFHT